MDYFEKLQNCLGEIRKRTSFVPKAAIVLGSGLGGLGSELKLLCEIPYAELPGFPVSTVSGHAGRFLLGTLEDLPVIVMQGRVHCYEGYSMKDVVLPIRLMGMMGAETLLLTNAAGGINPAYRAGALVSLSDHISSFIENPLIGRNCDQLGERFPDMTEVYDRKLRALLQSVARDLNIPLHEGIYAQMTGPSYETPAEVRMLGILGADVVGMSTACEAIAARHMGMRVCAVSCVTNMAAGLGDGALSHDEVKKTADAVGEQFTALVKAFFRKLSDE